MMVDLRNADSSKVKNFISIGFNKGYNFAEWASLWIPESNINSKLWYYAMQSTNINTRYACGYCSDCRHSVNKSLIKHDTPTSSQLESKMVIFGVDINSYHFRE